MRTNRSRTICLLLITPVVVSLCASCRLLPRRTTSSTPVCTNSLRIIDLGKEQAALAHGWTNGTPCDTAYARAEVSQYIKGGGVSCPQGGQYTYNPVGVDPVCSLGQTHASTIRYRLFKTTETRQHRLRE
jgi:hypothetical protein